MQILELYLNEIYYGNLAYGIEAAAETYFGKTANQLTLAEASFLAGLPQSPSVYDIYTNRDVTLARQQQVLVLMYGLSQSEGCIKVSNSEVPICVDEVAAANAANEMKAARLQPARHQHALSALGQLCPRAAGRAVRRADHLSLRFHRLHHARPHAAG